MTRPYISVVFATLNRLIVLKKTMTSIIRELGNKYDYEIVIVDGNSTDGTIDYLESLDRVKVIMENEPKGCCHAYDTAFRAASGEWICWLNDDIELVPGAFSKMVKFMEAPENAGVGMGVFPASRSRYELNNYVVNTCMNSPVPYADFGFLRRTLLEKIGYLDLNCYKYGWDPDLALKVWSEGLAVLPCPDAFIIHYFVEDDLRVKDEWHRVPDSDYLGKKWKKSAHEISKRIFNDPQYLKKIEKYLSHYDLTRILIFQGEFERAKPLVLEFVEEEKELSKWLQIYYQLGLELHKSGRITKAEEVYYKVISYKEYETELASWSFFKLGEIEKDRNEPGRAEAFFSRAIELKPDHAKAKIFLLSHDSELKVVVNKSGKFEKSEFIEISFDLFDQELWRYYFDQRRIDELIIAGGLDSLNGNMDDLSMSLKSYVKKDGIIKISINRNEKMYKCSAFQTLRNDMRKSGFSVEIFRNLGCE